MNGTFLSLFLSCNLYLKYLSEIEVFDFIVWIIEMILSGFYFFIYYFFILRPDSLTLSDNTYKTRFGAFYDTFNLT